MANERYPKKNVEGYSDPTAYEAIKNIESDEARFQKLLTAIFSICDLAGFHIEERVVIKDLKSGKVYR